MHDNETEKISDIEPNRIFRFAVCSSNNKIVDLHFGHVKEFFIYEYSNGNIVFLESRSTKQYCFGSEDGENHDAVIDMAELIKDCNCLICMRVGHFPSKVIEDYGISIFMTYDRIESAIKNVVESFGWV